RVLIDLPDRTRFLFQKCQAVLLLRKDLGKAILHSILKEVHDNPGWPAAIPRHAVLDQGSARVVIAVEEAGTQRQDQARLAGAIGSVENHNASGKIGQLQLADAATVL